VVRCRNGRGFLGRGSLTEDLAAQSERLGVSDRVHFLPAVPFEELAEWTCSADVGVQLLQNTCANHYTTDSNKLFEYAMAGLPVIASNFPEIRKILDDWEFGIAVDPADQDAVLEAILRLANDSDLRARYADAASRAAVQLDWSSQVPALLDAYRRALVPRSW
jgi:glycosyltransferase involved in cell wall biosynthesis